MLGDIFSFKKVFTVKNMIIMGMMVATAVVLSRFSLYITPTFKAISFAYLPGVLVSVLFGPWAALVFGFVSDWATFLANPQGFYFFGYAISGMVTYFIYACFLYKRPIQIWRVVLARALVIILVVFGLNFIWNSMMYGTIASKYFTSVRLINNLVQFPFHVAITLFLARFITKHKRILHIE